MIKITQTGGMELKITFNTFTEAQFLNNEIFPQIMEYNKKTRAEVLKELADFKNNKNGDDVE